MPAAKNADRCFYILSPRTAQLWNSLRDRQGCPSGISVGPEKAIAFSDSNSPEITRGVYNAYNFGTECLECAVFQRWSSLSLPLRLPHSGLIHAKHEKRQRQRSQR